MKQTKRIICITLCVLLIALSAAGVIWALYNKFASNKAYAEEIEEPQQTTFVNFNQYINFTSSASNLLVSIVNGQTVNIPDTLNQNVYCNVQIPFESGHTYYFYTNNYSRSVEITNNSGSPYITLSSQYVIFTSGGTATGTRFYFLSGMEAGTYSFSYIDLTQMFGAETANTMTLQQCQQLFKADYYPYNLGTTIDLSGFEQYNAGAMSARESMTINTTSANIAENLDNVVINSSYGSSNKALIQGYMVWGTQDQYTNCTALFNLETNFNENDYFEFEFYTITGADSINLPNISTFYDLQIIAVDSSGNIVPLANVKAQDNPNSATKATFYLPFSTDKLYITTPHKYIIGYNNFNINITTTNLTALSLYSYKDGYREGRSSGYTSGYNAGIAQQNATLGTMGYIQSAFNGIGSILQIELLPNVPFSLFVLLPLMFGLIAFVVKLSKGGS